MSYKGIKIKLQDGSLFQDTREWGCYVTESPFIPVPRRVKNIETQSWWDEDGDDEFIPEVLHYEPVEAIISFVYKGEISSALADIRAFINHLRSAPFTLYDEYHQTTYQRCRLIEYSDDATLTYLTPTHCLAKFSIVVKINKV